MCHNLTVLSELSVTIYQLVVIRKQVNYKLLFDDIFKYFIAGVLMFLTVLFWDRLMSDSWLSLVVEVIIGIVVYMICLLVLRAKILFKLKSVLNG